MKYVQFYELTLRSLMALAFSLSAIGCMATAEVPDVGEMTEDYLTAFEIERFDLPFCDTEGATQRCVPPTEQTFYVVLNDRLRTVALTTEDRVLSSMMYEGHFPPYALTVTMGQVCIVDGNGVETPIPYLQPSDYPDGVFEFILIDDNGMETDTIAGHWGVNGVIEDIWGIQNCENSLWGPCFIPM